MKKALAKFVFAAGIFAVALGMNLNVSASNAELNVGNDGDGGFTCPSGDKYKCAEKDGWVVYKGEGAVQL
jgi:hypothetical protein